MRVIGIALSVMFLALPLREPDAERPERASHL